MSEILYALDENDKIVKIDDVPNGKNCGCRCPLCGESLVAKNGGKIKIHHFAHEAECKYTEHLPQSQIHIMAKQIIEHEKKICVPHELGFREMSITEVKLETRTGDIIPDIIAKIDENEFIIEIYVTHKVDDAKKEKIRTLNIPAIEIDLHDLPHTITEDSLKSELYNPRRIQCIYGFDGVFINNKKNILLAYGIKIPIENNIVRCPNFFLNNLRISVPVKYSFCYLCVLGCKDTDENHIRCGSMFGNIIDLRIIVNENKIMTTEETKEYFRTFKTRLKQNCYEPVVQIAGRVRRAPSGPRINEIDKSMANKNSIKRSSYNNNYKRKKSR